VNIPVKEPWPWIIGCKADCHIITFYTIARRIPPNRIAVVVSVASSASYYGERVLYKSNHETECQPDRISDTNSMQVERMLDGE
jgi:hypothetical protein